MTVNMITMVIVVFKAENENVVDPLRKGEYYYAPHKFDVKELIYEADFMDPYPI